MFEITEEIDHHTTEKIRRRADYEIKRNMPEKVIFDFNRVIFMDSAGIGLIIGRYKTATVQNAKVYMINVKPKVKKVFEMSGLLRIVPIIENEEIADFVSGL